MTTSLAGDPWRSQTGTALILALDTDQEKAGIGYGDASVF
jgi:hypothetical protein